MSLKLIIPKSGRTVVSPIGLDVGPRRLRAAQVERCGDRWRVIRVTTWHLRGPEAGSGVNPGFARRVRRSMEQARYRGRRVIAGLSIPEVQLHALEIPTQGDMQDAAKFAEAVRWELGRVASMPALGAATSYWTLPPSKTTRTTAIGVIARLEDVQQAGEIAHSIGLDCDRVDGTACAAARLGSILRRRGDTAPQDIWSVLDVAHRMLRLVVSVGETPVLVRQLGTGSQSWTQSIAESLGVSVEAAESHKRDHGIAPPADAGGDDASGGIATMILNALRGDLDAVVGEVERSYEYVMRCYPDRDAGGVVLIGGGADLRGLDRYLAERLGVDVKTLQGFAHDPGAPLSADASLRMSLNRYGCAIGLAIDPEPSE